MNDFENAILKQLNSGMSIDEVLAKVHAQIHNAECEHKAQVEAARVKAEAEAKAKAEEEAKAKLQNGQQLADICNRALAGKLTAADVAHIQHMYAVQRYPNHANILAAMFDAASVDQVIDMAVDATKHMDPLLKLFDTTWDELLEELDEDSKQEAAEHARAECTKDTTDMLKAINSLLGAVAPTKPAPTPMSAKQKQKQSDDAILRSFLNTL